MQNVGLDLYRPRIETIDRGIALIDTQMELEKRLRDGYERSIQMIEIEMHDLEAEQAELGRQLAANAEVEALLKSPSSV
jgi:hypothetical protein